MATTANFPSVYKIVMMGGGGVGKSAVTIRFQQPNHFLYAYDPTIEDSYRKQILIDQKVAILEILDTAGQEEYSAMREQWIRYGEGFFLVYSIENRASFEKELSPLILQIQRVRDVGEIREIPIILFANKIDLENRRTVSTQEGKEFAQRQGIQKFFEGSAKEFTNIEESFFDLVRIIRRKHCPDLEQQPLKKEKKNSKTCSLL